MKGGSTFGSNAYGRKINFEGRDDTILHLNNIKKGQEKVKFYSFRFKAGSNVAQLADQILMIQHVKAEAQHLSDKEKRCRREETVDEDDDFDDAGGSLDSPLAAEGGE